jgi:hypothetical protein
MDIILDNVHLPPLFLVRGHLEPLMFLNCLSLSPESSDFRHNI